MSMLMHYKEKKCFTINFILHIADILIARIYLGNICSLNTGKYLPPS